MSLAWGKRRLVYYFNGFYSLCFQVFFSWFLYIRQYMRYKSELSDSQGSWELSEQCLHHWHNFPPHKSTVKVLSVLRGTEAVSLFQAKISSIILWQQSHEAIHGFSRCSPMMWQWEVGSTAVWQHAVLLWDDCKIKSSCNRRQLFTCVNKDSIPSQMAIPITCRGIKLWRVPAVFFFFSLFDFADYICIQT